MTTSTLFSIDLSQASLATRASGQAALERVLSALNEHPAVVIDFAGRSVTPSFADQCLGGLVSAMGRSVMMERVRLLNVVDSDRALIKHVLSRRSSAAHQEAVQ